MTKELFVQQQLSSLEKYIDDILSNNIVVGKSEKKTVEYFVRLKTKYHYNENGLIRVLRLFYYLNIPTVNSGVIRAGIMPFQLLWLAAIYGLEDHTGKRLINQCIISTGKKQSKSTFCSLIAINEMLNDDELGARVMIGANSTRQATIIIKYISDIIENSPLLSNQVEVWKSAIIHKGKTADNIITAVSTDGKNIQGLNTSCSIVDEFCFAKSMDIANKLKTGSVSRLNPLQILISTAGESRTTEAYQVIHQGKNILEGIVENDNTFVAIYELDSVEESNNVNPITLRKANPALGYTVTVDELLKAYAKAKLNSADLAAFKRDHLNCWSEDIGQNLWVDLKIINDSMINYKNQIMNSGNTLTDLITGETRSLLTNQLIPRLTLPIGSKVVIGCDFSSVSDLTGINITSYDRVHDVFHVENISILPSNERVVTRKGGLSLQKWIQEGYIIQNNLPVLNDDLVIAIFQQLKRRYKIENIGYDERLSGIIIQKIQNKLGLECTAVKQDAYSLGKPLNLIEKYLITGKYLIAPNPCIVWQAKNIVIWSDGNGNRKIMKNGSRDSVDNWIAMNISMNLWLRDNEHLFSEKKK